VIPTIRLVETKYHNAFTEADKRLTMPLVEVTRYLAVSIRDRVSGSGRGPDGAPWSAYPEGGKGKGWHWVEASERAGSGVIRKRNGEVLKPESGPHAGMMAYESYAAYKRTSAGRGGRNFKLTGQMWQSLRVRAMSLVRVRAAFSGGRERTKGDEKAPTNVKVAKWANRKERASILQPSQREIIRGGKILHRLVSKQWEDKLYTADINFQSRVLTAKVDRLTTRAGNAVLGLIGG
jgi:hypothetical protein